MASAFIGMSTANVAVLTTSQLNSLSTADYAVLTTDQVKAFTTSQLQALKTSYIAALTTREPLGRKLNHLEIARHLAEIDPASFPPGRGWEEIRQLALSLPDDQPYPMP